MLRSPWLQWPGVFCSKPDDWYGNDRRVTQITSGANALGDWGQTGANTANFVRSSLQSEGLLGAQCHLHTLGPFGKVPDRVPGAIFHALVQCVAPQGSQLYQIQNPICQLIAGAFVVALLPWDLLAISLQAFSPSPEFLGWLCVQWAHLYEAALRCLRAVLDPSAGPSGLQARGKLSTPLALACGSFSFPLHSCSPFLFLAHSKALFVYLSFHPPSPSSLSCWLSYSPPWLPPLYYPSLPVSPLFSVSFPCLFLSPPFPCPSSSSHISNSLFSHMPLLNFSVL